MTAGAPVVVDISGLVEEEPGALQRVARDLEPPAHELGAFQVVGHGIPQETLDRFHRAMVALFDLPREAKRAVRRSRDNAWGWYDEELTKNRRDWKEVFDFGAEREAGTPAHHSDGTNRWPPGSEALRPLLLAHRASCARVARALLRALCVGLDLAPSTLDPFFEQDSSFVRLNRYAPCPDPAPADAPLVPERGELGVHHHTDAGALTLVAEDDVGGLQFERDGRFLLATPLRGALTVNLGDMLQVWSNDRFRSPVHRVLANAERTRHSAPFFLNPAYETVAAPLPGVLGPGERALYRPISWAHFRDQRSAGDYADQGEEIQIAHYRTAG